MKKFLNRPLLALAAALGLVFLIILARMYLNVIDRLSESLMEREYNQKNSKEFDDDQQEWQPVKEVVEAPELSTSTTAANKIEITLGYTIYSI